MFNWVYKTPDGVSKHTNYDPFDFPYVHLLKVRLCSPLLGHWKYKMFHTTVLCVSDVFVWCRGLWVHPLFICWHDKKGEKSYMAIICFLERSKVSVSTCTITHLQNWLCDRLGKSAPKACKLPAKMGQVRFATTFDYFINKIKYVIIKITNKIASYLMFLNPMFHLFGLFSFYREMAIKSLKLCLAKHMWFQ